MLKGVVIAALSCGVIFGQSAMLKHETTAAPHVVVFAGDTVIPQFVDGSGWQTSLKFVNLDAYTTTFDVNFYSDAGQPMSVPINGLGVGTGLTVTLNPLGSITFASAGTSQPYVQGWAQVVRNATDSVAGFAIFRQTIPGSQPQEAVVPMVNQFSNHFVLFFDNTDYTTAMAIANPSPNTVVVPVNVRGVEGGIVAQHTITIGPYQHAGLHGRFCVAGDSGRAGSPESL